MCEREREGGSQRTQWRTDASGRVNSFDVLIFTDITPGPILYLGTCNYVELGGMLKYNMCAVCIHG